ncbi:hypothetical protein NCCP2222_21480 [Sporosarcina sp. NCCP-2222]|uniref:hypothetical protein n=1 Tax=Sporosarcina sp. NCCP-2222 TaxID=2935073 RepID=UPI002085BA04|nr:hypothetical protein [Sporosarcina sp. NCCP-2222]GKV56201.1 hypothetical protein NCCP2222_21480 [Sporosarcina sp. NCCP-2222]
MSQAVKWIFIGYLFVWFRIDIVIDWLPDPLGYFLIYLGASKLSTEYSVSPNASRFAAAGIILSLPSVFISLLPSGVLTGNYYILLLLVKLVVAFYLFSLLKAMTAKFNQSEWTRRTELRSKYYVFIHLTALFIMTLTPNLLSDEAAWLMGAASLALLVMDLSFLLLLNQIRNLEPRQIMDITV